MAYAAKHITNTSWDEAKPSLSLLAPYFKDNPCDLLRALDIQASKLGTTKQGNVEFIVYDDGTNDANLSKAVSALLPALTAPCMAIIADKNTGRSSARNRLHNAARANWILYLDADMRPVQDDFLARYLDLISKNDADVIFGGFKVEPKTSDKDRELHRALSEISDCLPLSERSAKGPQFVASSNLCMRKSVLEAENFDPEFLGWGWEDSEWAARIAQKYTLLHADNPALHLGLETTDTLLSRFATSGPNYLRFTGKHPELAQTLNLYKISKRLGKYPWQSSMQPILKCIVKSHSAPIKLRLSALKLWRASHYAQALK